MNSLSANKYCVLLVLLCLQTGRFAMSQVVLENLPPDVKWKQINTENFRIIFPSDFHKNALRVANTLEHLHNPVSQSLKIKPNKISIILQNQNIITNGFVAMAPRRSEFYTTPPQNYTLTGSMDWLDLLSVHEYRHVAQRDKSKTGFTKLS